MQPSDRQLLKQLRRATAELLGGEAQPERQALLGVMDVLVNELLLRSDRGFFLAHYARGRALLDAGLALDGTRATVLPVALHDECAMEVIAARLRALCDELRTLAHALSDGTQSTRRAWLPQVTAWETALYAHRHERAATDRPPRAGTMRLDPDSLLAYLRERQPGWRDLRITHFHRVAGGFSKSTILFDTEDAVNGAQSFAIRAEQPIHLLELDGSHVTNEFHLLRKAFACGIPVAEPLWLEADAQRLGTRFIVSRKAAGRNFGSAQGGEGQLDAAVVRDLARVMAAIHRIPMDPADEWISGSHYGKWLAFGNARENTLARVMEWQKQAADAGLPPSPATARAHEWLIANVPDWDAPPVFAHCDYGPHNILIDGDRVSAVLDWEISTPADPAYDVSWFLNCTGTAVDRQLFLDAYREAGGQPMDEFRLRYFDVFMCMVMPITTHAALTLVEDNDDANIQLAYYGLMFTHTFASRLEDAIALAEAARG